MKTTAQDIPLACNMNVFTPTERENHIETTRKLLQALQTVQEAQNGYQFTFPNESGIIKGLAEFMAKERLCCPFLEFTLKLEANHQPIALLLTGPEGAQEFLRAEFSEAFS